MHIRRLSRHHTSVENPVDNVENPRHTALYHFFTYLLLCILFCILPVKEKIMRPDMVRGALESVLFRRGTLRPIRTGGR